MKRQPVATETPRKKLRVHIKDGGQPTWSVAYVFPSQGQWTEEDYFALERFREGVYPLLELDGGRLEVSGMPTQLHQMIQALMQRLLENFVAAHAPGIVLTTGIKVRLGRRKFRMPDIVYMKAEHSHRRHEEYWDGADLVIEVVSDDPKDRRRDYVTKRTAYARGGVPEYWLIDPREQRITVLVLEGRSFREHGVFLPGQQASGVVLPGFQVAVQSVLNPPSVLGLPAAQDPTRQ